MPFHSGVNQENCFLFCHALLQSVDLNCEECVCEESDLEFEETFNENCAFLEAEVSMLLFNSHMSKDC